MTKLSHQPMILVVTFLTFLIIGISTGKYLEVKIFGPDLYLQKKGLGVEIFFHASLLEFYNYLEVLSAPLTCLLQ